jgi:hypothetical protein
MFILPCDNFPRESLMNQKKHVLMTMRQITLKRSVEVVVVMAAETEADFEVAAVATGEVCVNTVWVKWHFLPYNSF